MSTPSKDRDELAKILNDYVIHGVTTRKCKNNAYMVITLRNRIEALLTADKQRLLQGLMEEVETCPHYDRSLFRDGYTDDPADRRDMLEAAQVKSVIQNKLEGLS